MEVLASAAETPSYLPSHRKIGTKTDGTRHLVVTVPCRKGISYPLSVLLSKYYFVLTTFSLSYDNLSPRPKWQETLLTRLLDLQ
eukprot:scaffold7401_cov133-Skeletonema_dohrnii-CCMP3373.AAC.4